MIRSGGCFVVACVCVCVFCFNVFVDVACELLRDAVRCAYCFLRVVSCVGVRVVTSVFVCVIRL